VQPCQEEGQVMVMAAVDHAGPGGDLYQLLGVSREASHREIALVWRRRARDEHPDARPGDADVPGRFRALAGAWQVLGDPARRAAYDRVPGPRAAARGPGHGASAGAGGGAAAAGGPGPGGRPPPGTAGHRLG